MKHAIDFQPIHANILIIGARKKNICNHFFFVHDGAILIRLGKNEIAVSSGQSFWLPVNCLNAVTILQGSTISRVDFSVRTTLTLPASAGFIAVDTLLIGLIDAINSKAKFAADWHGVCGRLLRCLRDKIVDSNPTIQYNMQLLADISLIERIKQGGAIDDNVEASVFSLCGMSASAFSEQLMVREWVRQRKSGQDITQIADKIALNDTEIAEKMARVAGSI